MFVRIIFPLYIILVISVALQKAGKHFADEQM